MNQAIKKSSFRPYRSGEPESTTHSISWIPAFAGMTSEKSMVCIFNCRFNNVHEPRIDGTYVEKTDKER